MTTVRQPLEESGEPAVQMMTEQLRRPGPARSTFLELELVRRESEDPHAFLVFDEHVHVAWFRRDRYVHALETTGCGRPFAPHSTTLLPMATTPHASGPCGACLTVWQGHYDC